MPTMNESQIIKMRVWGPAALFSRPDVSPDRMSYDVITPTAAVGCFESVLWKPAMRWDVKRIQVLRLGTQDTIKTNEIKRGILNDVGYVVNDIRTQRTSHFLKNVDYIIEATISLTDKAGERDNIKKFAEMFKRRLKKGQCFRTPYLGLRQFTAYVSPADGAGAPINKSRDFGWMLRTVWPAKTFFYAVMKNGTIVVPKAKV